MAILYNLIVVSDIGPKKVFKRAFFHRGRVRRTLDGVFTADLLAASASRGSAVPSAHTSC